MIIESYKIKKRGDEYVVTFYGVDGKLIKDSTYFASDLDDAEATAKHVANHNTKRYLVVVEHLFGTTVVRTRAVSELHAASIALETCVADPVVSQSSHCKLIEIVRIAE